MVTAYQDINNEKIPNLYFLVDEKLNWNEGKAIAAFIISIQLLLS